MEQQQDLSLLEEQQQRDIQPELFEREAGTTVVPPNTSELAAQMAFADDTSDGEPFDSRYANYFNNITANGAGDYLESVAQQERDDQLAALTSHADQAAASGNPKTLEEAARLLADHKERMAQRPSTMEGLKAAATRSLELTGLRFAADRYSTIEAFSDKVDEAAEAVSLRNLVAMKMQELDATTTLWDKVSHFLGQVLLSPVYEVKGQQALAKVTGDRGLPNPFNSMTSVEELRALFNGLTPQERVHVVNQLAKEELGIFGENKSANIELLRKLAEMRRPDAAMDTIFNSLTAVDVVQIGRLLAIAVRRGTPLKAINDTAGPEVAAKVAVSDLANGTKIAGLNDAELMAKFLAVGKNPMDLDPAAFAGMSAAGQTELRVAWTQLLERTRERLISSGLTPDEVKAGLAEIRAKYSVETNKAIHNVVFGEGSELGQEMTVFWQGPDGRAFATKEAAEAWAKAEGKVGYEIVPKNSADEVFPQFGGGDGPIRPEPKDPIGPDILESLKGKTAEEIDGFFDNAYLWSLDDPAASELVDLWRGAAKAGQTKLDAESVLSTIGRSAQEDDLRFLSQHLLFVGRKNAINWKAVKLELLRDDAIRGRKGAYAPSIDRVRINLTHGVDPETLVHELVHAHNAQVITLARHKGLAKKVLTPEQLSAVDDLGDLTKRLKDWNDRKVWKELEKHGGLAEELGKLTSSGVWKAALENPAEMLAYGMTNQNVRDILHTVKLTDLGYKGDQATVWSKLWDIFRKVLGLRANDTALAKLARQYERLANTVSDGQRDALTLMVREGTMTIQDMNGLMRSFNMKGAKPHIKLKAGTRGEWLVKERRTDPVSFTNVGKFSEEDIRSMPWMAVDPKHAASELAVEERVIGVHGTAKMKKDLTNFLAPFFDKLDRKSNRRVFNVLAEGDAYSNVGGQVGKEFTYHELMARGLNDAEAQAYFAARQARMVSYHFRNAEMVRALRADGFKEVEFLGTGEKVAGRVYSREQANVALSRGVYDTVAKEQVFLDSAKLDDAYAAGKKVVELKQPIQQGGHHYFTLLVDDATAKHREIVTALHYRPGEFARIYSDQYFITVKKMMEVDGKVQEVNETVRTAASAREAQEFVESHKKAVTMLMDRVAGRAVPKNFDAELEKLIGKYSDPKEFVERFEKHEFDGFIDMDFHYTRNKEEFLNGSVSEAMTNGRLFTSKRSDKLLSVDRDRVNTLDVFESMEAELTNVSRVVNITQWRDTMIRRWMNTFGDMVPNRTGNDIADFFSVVDASFTRGTREAQFAERTHRYIMRQIGLRTQEERYWEGLTRTWTEKLFTGSEPVESIGAKIRTMSWLGFIRNINFNLNLGMLNPAQLLVQANGAAAATILSPLHGLAAAKTFPLLRMALMSDNPKVWRNLARVEKLTNLGLSSEDEFIKMVKAVRKSGIIDNIRSTALWNLEDGALNVFGGYPRRALKEHAFFFNRGEEFSRIVGFDVARREWLAAHPGGDWTRPDIMKKLVVRMDDLTQNMTKANLARFQEGLLSIPLQFAQYNIKLAANVIGAYMSKGQGRGFTKSEATRLLIGHILLYGAAGNGLVGLVDEVLGEKAKSEMSDGAKNIIAQGVMSWLFDAAAELVTGEGAKVALGSRLGSFDYYQRIGEALFKDPKNVYEALLGPTVSSAKRLGAIGEVAQLWWRDPEVTASDIMEGLGYIAKEQVASLRNATKAYIYMTHQGKMLDRQGVALAKVNDNEILMQALGFAPTASFDVHNLIQSKKDHNEAMDDIARLVIRTQTDILTALNRGDEKRADELKKLLQALWPTNAGDFMDVQRRVRDRLFPYDTQMQRLLGEYLMKGQTYTQPLVVTQEPKKAQ